jgi:hypothetical protein
VDKEVVARVIGWAAKHILTTWAIIYAIGATVSLIRHTRRLGDIWFWTEAPFMSVMWLVAPVVRRFGQQVGDMIEIGLLACIYIGMDVVLWTVIRSGGRGRALGKRDSQRALGVMDRIDLASAWLVEYAFPLWALVTATGLYFAADVKDIFDPTYRSMIFYGSLYLALPLWPIVVPLWDTLDDPVIRAIVLSGFVIACVFIDIIIKRQVRRERARRAAQSATDEHQDGSEP